MNSLASEIEKSGSPQCPPTFYTFPILGQRVRWQLRRGYHVRMSGCGIVIESEGTPSLEECLKLRSQVARLKPQGEYRQLKSSRKGVSFTSAREQTTCDNKTGMK